MGNINSSESTVYDNIMKRLTELIAEYQTDIETVAKHPANKDLFPPMRVSGILYAEKKDADTSIIVVHFFLSAMR